MWLILSERERSRACIPDSRRFCPTIANRPITHSPHATPGAGFWTSDRSTANYLCRTSAPTACGGPEMREGETRSLVFSRHPAAIPHQLRPFGGSVAVSFAPRPVVVPAVQRGFRTLSKKRFRSGRLLYVCQQNTPGVMRSNSEGRGFGRDSVPLTGTRLRPNQGRRFAPTFTARLKVVP
jgi:hypothetical protein